jgi:hypothetical protein
MKTSAYQRYKYSADVYKFVRKTVGDTSTIDYYFAGTVPVQTGVDKTQRMIIRCEQPFDLGTILLNVKDANDELILGDTKWQINNLQPIFNSFGTVESYRMTAVKYQGTI